MKATSFVLLLVIMSLIACSNKKKLVVENSIITKVTSKGYSIKDYHILTQQEEKDFLIIRYSATVVSPVTFQETVDIDNVKLRKTGDDIYALAD